MAEEGSNETSVDRRILQQIDAALVKWEAARKKAHYDDCSDLPDHEVTELITVLAATARRAAPLGSVHRTAVDGIVEKHGVTVALTIADLAGILLALRSDYLAGYLDDIQELVHASVFADFLEMADHLLNEGYKDPAAVLAGGVLEEHLRKLCEKNGIDTESAGSPKKADMLTSQLTEAGAYEKLDQKSVTAWLDLRNKAAHANYDEYAKEQVASMTQGIRDFLTRHPA